MNQETLEEAAERFSENHSIYDSAKDDTEYGFINGAKWQAERMYSEQEVRDLLETQRGNCYVAILSQTKNDEIASIAIQSPEPGGKNGTWVK